MNPLDHTFDLDTIIDRRGTGCLKYDFAVQRGKPADVLPFWVADMDFRVAEPIIRALHARVDHGIFGYSEAGTPTLKHSQTGRRPISTGPSIRNGSSRHRASCRPSISPSKH